MIREGRKPLMDSKSDNEDIYWMRKALDLAGQSEQNGEVPVGAIIVRDGEILGQGWNRNIGLSDPTAHAEIMALREAGAAAGNHRLPGCSLFVTLEPCCMCAGAMIHARLERLVFGATDPKTGALGGRFDILTEGRHNHTFAVQGACLETESSMLLKSFFQARRQG